VEQEGIQERKALTMHIIAQLLKKIFNKQDKLPIAYGVVLPAGSRILVCTGALVKTTNLRIQVTCPYCGRQHIHGWHSDPKLAGRTRGSHCAPGGIYEIRTVRGDK